MVVTIGGGGGGTTAKHPTTNTKDTPYNKEFSDPKCQYCWTEGTNQTFSKIFRYLYKIYTYTQEKNYRYKKGTGTQ